MVLTSTPLRRRGPKTTPGIPTIPAGRLDGRIVNVSAVDTGPRRSESVVRTAEPDASVAGPSHRSLTVVCTGARFEGLGGGLGGVPTHHLSRVPVVMVRLRHRPEWARVGPSRPASRGAGSTGQGLCVPHEGPTYPQYPRPSSSSAPPPRAVHPDDDGSHHTDRACPSGRLKQQPSHPAGAPTPSLPLRSYLMSRGRGL